MPLPILALLLLAGGSVLGTAAVVNEANEGSSSSEDITDNADNNFDYPGNQSERSRGSSYPP